jgi:hypothetical protein
MADFKIKTIVGLITLYDMILVIAIMLIAVLSIYNRPEASKRKVLIYYQENLLGIYDLSKDMEIRIDENSTAQISNNRIRMVKSDCPDKLCVKQGWSYSVPVICLPNKIVMEIYDVSEKHELHILH